MYLNLWAASESHLNQMRGAQYSLTASTDNGVIHQLFSKDKKFVFQVEFYNTPAGNSIKIHSGDGQLIDIRSDGAYVVMLRGILKAYLENPSGNERARSDVSSALLLLDDARVGVHTVRWLGSRK